MSKKSYTKRLTLLATLMLVAITLIGFSSQAVTSSTVGSDMQPAAATTNGPTFTAAWFGTFIDTLNPFTSYSQLTDWINLNTYLPLVYFNPANDSVMPGLASSWTVNYANHTVIFNLNPNAVWSDGQPVTSQDVVYTYNIAAQNYTFISEYTAAITNVSALGTHTVMITFKGVLWTMFAAYIFVVPAHVWSSVDPATYAGYNSTGSTYFVGDGPFVLTKYVTNQYAEIQANQKWFIPSEMPKLKTVFFEEFSSQSSAISSLQSGTVQGLARILPANVGQFQNNANYTVSVAPNLEYLYLSINVDPNGTGNPTLQNLTVRQAIAHALNYSYIAQTVYHGYAQATASVLAPSGLYYDNNLTSYSYNVSLANQMLNNSGFAYSGSVRESPTGVKLSYNLLVPSGDTLAVQMAQLIALNLTSIGVHINVEPMTTGSMASIIWSANGTLGQDMDIWDWFDNIASAPQLLSVFLSDQVVTGTSDSGFTNSTYDNLWTELLNASSPALAHNISNQMQQILHDQLPYIPLVVPSSINVWSSAYTNVSSDMPGGPFGGGDWLTFIQIVPPTTQTTAPNYTMYYLIGGILAIIVVAAVVVTVMRSRGRE